MTGESTGGAHLDVLGPLVLYGEGVRRTPASPIARRLLCLLACRAPDTVTVGELVAVAWPDNALPKEPEQNLHTHVARIRRLGGAGQGQPGLVETHAGAYRLTTGAVVVDLDVLATLIAPGLGPHDDPSTRRRLTRALSLWRGPSLSDIADTDPGRGDAVRLDELRLSITEAHFECVLATGAPAELIHDLAAFTAAHPYRERPYAVLMQALNDLGRHADALAAYQRLRRRLGDDLGLEPSPALQGLETDILGHRLTTPSPRRQESPGWSLPAPPARLSSLVGRADALTAVEAAMDRSRLVTIVGTGGVGKTRLALELAHRHGDGGSGGPRLVWCDLTPAGDEADVVDLLALSVRARRRPDETMHAAAVRAVAHSEPLLMLDNCEQVAESAATIVNDLLQRSEQVRILATSRVPFDLPGEAVVRLEPLRFETQPRDHASKSWSLPPPAVELFVERCEAAGVDVRIQDPDLAQVTHICRAVDGLPLGIELAASQLRNMTLPQLVHRLGPEGALLEVGRRRGPARQRSIGATLEWSYRLLDSDDQRLLAAVSTCSGSFDADAVCALTGARERFRVEDRLRALSDLSLLAVEPGLGEPRFRLLLTTRGFGRKMLVEQGHAAELTALHHQWVRRLAEALDRALRGPAESDAARTVEVETENIRAVLSRASADGDVDTTLGICCSLADFAHYRLRDDIFTWTDRALAMSGVHDHPRFGRGLASLARGLTSRGELSRAEEYALRALQAAPDDPVAVVCAHHALSLTALYSGQLAEAVAAASTQLAVAESVHDDVGAQAACLLVALASLYCGDHDTAQEWMDRLTALADQSAQPSAQAWANYGLGEVLAHRQPERAASCLERAIAIGEAVGNVFVVGVAEVSLAAMRSAGSDPDAALRTFGRLIRRWDARNDWTHQWTTLQNMAPLLARSGAAADAAVLVGTLTATTEQPLFGDAAQEIGKLEGTLAAELGDARFQELRARGAALSRQEIVTLALRLAGGAPQGVSSRK